MGVGEDLYMTRSSATSTAKRCCASDGEGRVDVCAKVLAQACGLGDGSAQLLGEMKMATNQIHPMTRTLIHRAVPKGNQKRRQRRRRTPPQDNHPLRLVRNTYRRRTRFGSPLTIFKRILITPYSAYFHSVEDLCTSPLATFPSIAWINIVKIPQKSD